MTITALIVKLTDNERSIGVETNSAIRNRIIDAQDYALDLQKEIMEVLRGRPQTASGPSMKSLRPVPACVVRSLLFS